MKMQKVQEQDAGQSSDDGMRNKEQHEGKNFFGGIVTPTSFNIIGERSEPT